MADRSLVRRLDRQHSEVLTAIRRLDGLLADRERASTGLSCTALLPGSLAPCGARTYPVLVLSPCGHVLCAINNLGLRSRLVRTVAPCYGGRLVPGVPESERVLLNSAIRFPLPNPEVPLILLHCVRHSVGLSLKEKPRAGTLRHSLRIVPFNKAQLKHSKTFSKKMKRRRPSQLPRWTDESSTPHCRSPAAQSHTIYSWLWIVGRRRDSPTSFTPCVYCPLFYLDKAVLVLSSFKRSFKMSTDYVSPLKKLSGNRAPSTLEQMKTLIWKTRLGDFTDTRLKDAVIDESPPGLKSSPFGKKNHSSSTTTEKKTTEKTTTEKKTKPEEAQPATTQLLTVEERIHLLFNDLLFFPPTVTSRSPEASPRVKKPTVCAAGTIVAPEKNVTLVKTDALLLLTASESTTPTLEQK
ncbi:hypothetical protein QR680_006823 [Steinernema hermaphroditum]|uniref:Uncharacterized protein n=1 Tax=Steinernema hermaphroditum TaxID=289476 RepID=A0AA39LY03_9BILA|nr:hypothetical protein QR680_006823 [Steinernema hermaphroditum]